MQNFTQLFEITKAAQQANFSSADTYSDQIYVTEENKARTLYIADLPKSITLLDLSEFFETNVGPCTICIKR
jgi:hypothetical protein